MAGEAQRITHTIRIDSRAFSFIPWDDDVDILMTNEDIETLRDMLLTGDVVLGPDYVAIYRTGKHSDCLPVKIVHKRSGHFLDIWALGVTDTMYTMDHIPKIPGW